MERPEYISGLTLIDYNDPNKLLVIGTWQNIEGWLEWKEDKARKAFEEILDIYQEGPTEYEIYLLGSTSER